MKTMILIIRDFKDDGKEFYLDERRKVSDEKATYYKNQGWAVDADKTAADATPVDLSEKTLEVQKGSHKSSATKPS